LGVTKLTSWHFGNTMSREMLVKFILT